MRRFAVFVAIISWICASAAWAQRRYMVDGKQVSAATYQACQLTQEAMARLSDDKVADAKALLAKALAVDPKFAPAHSTLGLAYLRQGLNTQAAVEVPSNVVPIKRTRGKKS